MSSSLAAPPSEVEADQVFTWEIVDALVSGKADTNRDGTITLDELQAYVSRNVAVKTGGLQRPTMDRDNIHQRFGFPVLR